MGPVYLVIFCYWVGPVPYLELFGAGPVEKNTLYIHSSQEFHQSYLSCEIYWKSLNHINQYHHLFSV